LIIWSQFQFLVTDDSMDKIDMSLTLSWSMLDHNQCFIRFRTEKERSPSVFAAGSVRYSCVPASRGALCRGLQRLCLNPPLSTGETGSGTERTTVESIWKTGTRKNNRRKYLKNCYKDESFNVFEKPVWEWITVTGSTSMSRRDERYDSLVSVWTQLQIKQMRYVVEAQGLWKSY
jgi:hypothetical protein